MNSKLNNMNKKEYLVYFAINALAFGAIRFLLDLWTDETQTILNYTLSGVVFGFLMTIIKYFEDKGHINWKKRSGKDNE